MAGLIKKVSKTAGLAPGVLVHVGDKKTEKTRITIIDYNEAEFQERVVKKVEECYEFRDSPTVTWINIDGINDLEAIEKIGRYFGFHPLIMEDIVNTGQRPKTEDFENYLFIVLKMIYLEKADSEVKTEQVSIIFGSNFVISFQEKEGDVFDPVRERIRQAKGRVRKMGPDYLAYTLLDAIVDSYFFIIEDLGERIESVEEILVSNPTPQALRSIHKLKNDMLFLRKSIWPLREVISGLQRSESRLINKSTEIYLKDVYDHTIQIIDAIETFRDMVSGMLDIYLSSLSNRMNEVMKVLTIIATIFIPLTFIVGIYGMNFNPQASPFNMPELNWKYGYAFVWCIMILAAAAMAAYFRRKKWF